MQTRFATLMNDFTLFVGDFANWAKSHEEGLDQKIADLNEEIAELQALLSRLEKSMYGMGAGVVVGGLLMRFASLTGPAAPFVTVRFPMIQPIIML